MTVCAPAGYGKTTLLAQWAARDARPFAWISADERDDDPVVLLTNVAAALDPIGSLDQRVVDALGSPDAVWSSALPRLGSYLRSLESPLVLVIDDSHRVRSRYSLQVLSTLAEHMTEGSTLVLAGRVTPRLPIALLRANGLLTEVDHDDLALTRREAQLLLQATGVELSPEETTELVSRCEGWAAALYLAGLSLREERNAAQRPRSVQTFRGDDKYLTDYLRSEYLSGLRPATLRFMRRTSVLERMSGPLCDSILAADGSGHALEKIERSNVFLVSLDHHRGWHRYHALLRDLLQRELEQTEPHLVPVLHGRAADWYEAHGEPESALEHAAAAGDMERAARIVTAIALPAYHRGRVATVEAWLARFDDTAILDRFPALGVQGAWIHALRGRMTEAERWLEAAENATVDGSLPDGRASLGPWIAVLRAAMCRDGVEQMLADAETARGELPAESLARPFALLVLGAAYMMLGQTARADGIFAEAAEQSRRLGAADTRVVAISERSLIAFERGDMTGAQGLAAEAHELVARSNLEGYATSALALAASARALLRRGNWAEAKARLAQAADVGLGSARLAFPWLAVQTRLELAHAYLALRDGGTTRSLLSEIDEIVRMRPHLGVLSDRASSLRAEVDALRERSNNHVAGLSHAELRLLPFLATHLSFAEIGARLYVSRNTIKTQALSIYRRFGVSNRSEAIAEADRLGLIDLTSVSSRALLHGG
jgi:LuxR family maltose regulon positive regulatory protein